MKRAILLFLVLVNLGLGVKLLRRDMAASREDEPKTMDSTPATKQRSAPSAGLRQAPLATEPATPFEAVYSSRPAAFVANLRRIGCPEETVRDIMIAEMNSRYRGREADLKPKPADHVPWGWSPKTSEAKLIERRQQAAAIAREKAATLREALGYEVEVPMPLYAMTVSDRKFQAGLESIPEKLRPQAYQVQDQYWNRVEQLRFRTRGFWEPEDVRELEEFKKERAEALENIKQAAQ